MILLRANAQLHEVFTRLIQTMKINVKGVAETMIQTLYARAKETSQKNFSQQVKLELHLVL